MKIVQKSNAISFSNSVACTGYEYSFNDRDLNSAVITINGRYPEKGYILNEVCKEVAYVLKGSGRIGISGEEVRQLAPGDAVMILPGERFFGKVSHLNCLYLVVRRFIPDNIKKWYKRILR